MTLFTPAQVASVAALLLLTFLLSWKLQLGISRDLAVGIVRSVLQLMAVGLTLTFLFGIRSPVWVVGIVLVMVLLGAQVSSKRSPAGKQVFPRAAASIGLGAVVTLILLMLIGIIPMEPGNEGYLPNLRYFLPLAGIIIGNSVNSASVAFERLGSDMGLERSLIEAALTEGATPWEAVAPTAARSIRAGLIGPIDTLKIMGAVSLPGAAVGMIIAGADPVQAVCFQLIVAYALLFSRTLTTCLAVLLVFRLYK